MKSVLVQFPLFVLKTFGHLVAICTLLSTGLLCGIIDSIGRVLSASVAKVTLANIEQDSVVLHDCRVATEQSKLVYEDGSNTMDTDGPPQIVDTKASLSEVEAKGAELIAKTKVLVLAEFGAKRPDLLSDDFQFTFPVVGPLGRDEFVEAFSSFKLRDAFPESRGNYFGFCQDPLEPNRIWFISRGTFPHTGTLNMGVKYKPTGKTINVTPQTLSMSFDEQGKCYKLTGYADCVCPHVTHLPPAMPGTA